MRRRAESPLSQVIFLAALVVAGGLTIGLLLSLLNHWRGRSDHADQSTVVSTLQREAPAQSSAAGSPSVVAGGDSSSRPRARGDSSVAGGAVPASSGGITSSAADSYAAAQARLNRDRPVPLPFDCDSSFRADDTHETLARRYGARNVTADSILVGEGFFEPGTVLFASDSLRRAEVVWRDTTLKRNPRVVWARGSREGVTAWQTRDGISLQTELRTIESLNGKPFRLTGFGWDYGGTVMSWEQGRLERYSSAVCDIRLRLSPDDSGIAGRQYRQVIGEAEFSSAHPTMQALNPRVTDLFLQFK